MRTMQEGMKQMRGMGCMMMGMGNDKKGDMMMDGGMMKMHDMMGMMMEQMLERQEIFMQDK